jgi:hypothetical protein
MRDFLITEITESIAYQVVGILAHGDYAWYQMDDLHDDIKTLRELE